MKKDYFKYVFNNLIERGIRSWLTVIGILIGIAAIVSLIGLGEGLQQTVRGQFGFLGSDVLSVEAASAGGFGGPPGTRAITPLSDELEEDIENIQHVEAAFNRQIESGFAKFNEKQITTAIASTPSGKDREVFEKMTNLEISEGRLLEDKDSGKIVLGSNFKNEEKFGEPLSTRDKITINNKRFEVVGILEPKGSFIFDDSIFMNNEDVRNLFGDDGNTDIIAVKVENVNYVEEVEKELEEYMREERNVEKGEEDFTVESPQQTLQQLNSTLFAIQLFIYLIASISLFIGGIGIMNTMYTSVKERTKEIGIMKAIGATNKTIATIFMIEAGSLGLIGGIIGTILGIITAYSLAYLGSIILGTSLIQVSISPYLVVGALTFSFVVGTIAGILPAINASKLQPVESIRDS